MAAAYLCVHVKAATREEAAGDANESWRVLAWAVRTGRQTWQRAAPPAALYERRGRGGRLPHFGSLVRLNRRTPLGPLGLRLRCWDYLCDLCTFLFVLGCGCDIICWLGSSTCEAAQQAT